MEAEAAVGEQANFGVQALEAGVGDPEGDRSEDALAVAEQCARQADERP